MLETKKISIHRALAELKLLDKQIADATESVVAVKANRKSNTKIDGFEVNEYKQRMQSSFDKVVGLINYRNKLKAAVVQSNALTKVSVAGTCMTVAEAIERKTSIEYERALLNDLRHEYRKAVAAVNANNDALPAKLETYLVNILGSKDKQSAEEVKLHTDTFMKRNEYELLDPLNITKVIDKLQESINAFETDVDAVLSESNATTFIEITI